jgi:hypothetical protein
VRPHGEAIEQLRKALPSCLGLRGSFHSGVEVRAILRLLPEEREFFIDREKPIRLRGRKKIIPDLTVRCSRTLAILLVIEVWHTHAVNDAKRKRFASAGIRWIEVSCWHVIRRQEGEVLPILDWGGFDEVPEPHQGSLVSGPELQVSDRGAGATVSAGLSRERVPAGPQYSPAGRLDAGKRRDLMADTPAVRLPDVRVEFVTMQV